MCVNVDYLYLSGKDLVISGNIIKGGYTLWMSTEVSSLYIVYFDIWKWIFYLVRNNSFFFSKKTSSHHKISTYLKRYKNTCVLVYLYPAFFANIISAKNIMLCKNIINSFAEIYQIPSNKSLSLVLKPNCLELGN